MSHTVKIQTQFKQINPLKRAFEHFGWKIVENSKARTYSGDPKQNDKYQFVAVNPDLGTDRVFDVGINVNANGEIDVYGDMWGGSISKSLGSNLDKLRQEYAYRVIEEKYTYEGASVFRTANQDGTMTVDVDLA
jgi:hypothetical protein